MNVNKVGALGNHSRTACRCYFFTVASTLAAFVGARLHLTVVLESVAGFGTVITCVDAKCCRFLGKFRASSEEFCAHLASSDTVFKSISYSAFGVRALLLYAVVQGLLAISGAGFAIALSDLRRSLSKAGLSKVANYEKQNRHRQNYLFHVSILSDNILSTA